MSILFSYRISNDGKFPSVNLTHKEVGGSYYIVREIVRDIIQENKILGPGGLNSKTLSFEDCPDSLELSIRQELDQDNIEILGTSDEKQVDMDSVLEVSNSEEVFSSQKNVISTQQLLGSSHLLEASVLNSVVRNGNLADTACLETNLEKEDEVPCGRSIDIDMNSSDRQAPSFAHVSDSDKEIELESLGDGHEGTSSSITDEVILSSESSAVFQTNEALLQEHVTSPNDHHDDITSGAVDEAKVSSETNGVHQMNQTLLQQDEMLPESVTSDDVPVIDGQFSSTVDAFNSNTSYPETEGTAKFVEVSGAQRAQDEFEQSMLDASPDEQEKSGGLVSHPELDTKGLLHMKDKLSAVEEDASEFNKSISTITKEEREASNAKHGDGISTRTAISRHALCLLTLRCMLTIYTFLHTSQKATAY